jgi:hypothetical protein
MHVIGITIVRTAERDDAFSAGGWRAATCKRVETAPGNAGHSDRACRPCLAGKPGDDLLGIVEFLLGIFVGEDAFGIARATNIHAAAGKAMARHIGVHLHVAKHGAVAAAIRNELENRRYRLFLGVFRQPDRGGQPHAVLHRDEDRIEAFDLARESVDDLCHGVAFPVSPPSASSCGVHS